MKLVSIIVPVYNGEKYISECIDSLLSQNYKKLEIIVIDDGSKDETLTICKKCCGNKDNIKIIHNDTSQGVSIARNIGLSYACGSYIMFCDSDDIMHHTTVSVMVDFMEKSKSDLVVCGYQKFEKKEEIKDYSKHNPQTILLDRNESMQFVLSEDKYAGFVWNKIFKKSVILENEIEFKQSLSILEDQLFVLEYIKNINGSVFVRTNLYFYRLNPLSALNRKFDKKKYTVINARYYIYKLIKENTDEVELLSIAWNDLLRTCISCYYNLAFNENENAYKWKIRIKSIIHEEKNKFKLDNRWNYKFKLLYIMLEFLAFLEDGMNENQYIN